MRHDDKNNPVATLTPQEAVKLGRLRTIDDEKITDAICQAFYEEKKRFYVNDFQYFMSALLATVWNAGRIEGIRAERKRRKQASLNYKSKGA